MSDLILVTGGTGQVARALGNLGGDEVRVVGRPAFDFDAPERIVPMLSALRPRVVVNAAAFTAVDAAETDPEAAARANTSGPAMMATWCGEHSIPFVHISTDYVFDGLKGSPYTESDQTRPTGVYGRTKRDGEQAVLAAHPDAIVVRTSWVYAESGRNFVLTMLNAARSRPELRVVADQIGCPTAAADLAAVLLAIARRVRDGLPHAWAGVVHAAGTGWCSWHDLASATLREAGLSSIVTPISTAEWPTPASRPPDSRLDCARLQSVFGLRLPPWQDSLSRTVAAALAR